MNIQNQLAQSIVNETEDLWQYNRRCELVEIMNDGSKPDKVRAKALADLIRIQVMLARSWEALADLQTEPEDQKEYQDLSESIRQTASENARKPLFQKFYGHILKVD